MRSIVIAAVLGLLAFHAGAADPVGNSWQSSPDSHTPSAAVGGSSFISAKASVPQPNVPSALPQWFQPVPESSSGIGLEVSELFLRSLKTDTTPRMHMGRGEDTFSVGMNAEGKFSVAITANKKPQDIMVVSGGGMSVTSAVARAVNVQRFSVNNIPQWALHFEDMFSSPPTGGKAASLLESESDLDLTAEAVPSLFDDKKGIDAHTSLVEVAGWSAAPLTVCSGLSILTIAQAQQVLSKAYASLPDHTHIRVVATVHLWDDWQGETVYLKVGEHYVWTESHELRNGAHALSVCGSPLFPETKFTTSLDVTFPHNNSGLKLLFGTTMEKNSDARFGISTISIYYRTIERNGRKPKPHMSS